MRALLLAVVFALVPLGADADVLPSALPTATTAPTVTAVLAQLAASPDQPPGYQASVALHVRLRIFPFIHLTLHGESTYQRPGLYHFLFRGMPLVGRAFSNIKYDLGDPVRWPERYDVAFAPQSTPERPVLRLTPKTHGLVTALDVALDRGYGRILRATWSRSDGGVITLVQTYVQALGREVVAEQDATIDLPRMKASLQAQYADFHPDDPASPTP